MKASEKKNISKKFNDELCMFYFQIEDYMHAIEAARHILQKQSDNYTALLVMGLINEANGKYDAAIRHYNDILDSYHEDALALKRRAYVEMNTGREKEALRDINHSLKLDNKDAEAYIIRGLIYFYYYQNKIEAIINYNKALQIDPLNISALYNRGYSYLKYGNYNYARDDFMKAANLGYRQASEMLDKYFTSNELGTTA